MVSITPLYRLRSLIHDVFCALLKISLDILIFCAETCDRRKRKTSARSALFTKNNYIDDYLNFLSFFDSVFICDIMLGKLARWLRILGYDTLYVQEDDNNILAIAEREKRVLLTRDKELAKRDDKGFLVRGFSIDEQLMELMKAKLISVDMSKMLTRCTLCNSVLKPMNKDSVKDKIPEKSFENSERFWHCEGCGKYYWIGKHWDDIRGRLEKISLDPQTSPWAFP